jgi:hypothetical protein
MGKTYKDRKDYTPKNKKNKPKLKGPKQGYDAYDEGNLEEARKEKQRQIDKYG